MTWKLKHPGRVAGAIGGLLCLQLAAAQRGSCSSTWPIERSRCDTEPSTTPITCPPVTDTGAPESAAPAVAARAVSRGERIGSLQPGYQADIALIDAPNLNHWMYHFQANACQRVIKKGQWV